MITIETESKLLNGLVRRRYSVKITDRLGGSHTDVLGMFDHEPSNDGSSVEADFLSSKKQQEVEQYKADIEKGIDPFVSSKLRWNSLDEMLKAIYVENKLWVDSVKQKASELLTAKTILDNNQAVL